jgi:hypothetical protein
LAIINLFKIAAFVSFEEERLNNILSQRLEEQLRELVVGILLSFADQVQEIESNRIRQGKYLNIDNMDWNLAT